MKCSNCSVTPLKFEIKMEEVTEVALSQKIFNHLKRRGFAVEEHSGRFALREDGAKELWDFCLHHMKEECISFRLEGQQNWQPFSEMARIFSLEWIDEVITKELLTCFYQPIVNTEEEIFAYELLARFHQEDGSMIYPNEIFSAAKSRGRLYALDRICRMTAVRHATKLKNTKAFINFIPTSIYSPEYCLRSTTNLANQLGVNPEQLVFEVVETEKVDDLDHLKTILAFYKEKGFQYALDDVGEGYSTIEVLGDLKPHFMKLDMQFVQGVAEDAAKQQTALKFLKKSSEIGSIPLAEGVETRQDFDWLKKQGYQLFQGYYFGKPAESPIEEGVRIK